MKNNYDVYNLNKYVNFINIVSKMKSKLFYDEQTCYSMRKL